MVVSSQTGSSMGDYMGGIDVEHRPYNLISDLKELQHKIEGFLEDYNSGTKNPHEANHVLGCV